jgi:hypothetical protein
VPTSHTKEFIPDAITLPKTEERITNDSNWIGLLSHQPGFENFNTQGRD